MTVQPIGLQRSIVDDAFLDAFYDLLQAARAADQAKAAAKRTILDEYRKGQLAEWGVLDLIQKHGLESA